jgi:hypothetical protein
MVHICLNRETFQECHLESSEALPVNIVVTGVFRTVATAVAEAGASNRTVRERHA